MEASKTIQLMILSNLNCYAFPQELQLIQLVQQSTTIPENLIIEELQRMDQNHLNYLNLVVLDTTNLKASSIPSKNVPWLTSAGNAQLQRLKAEMKEAPIIQNTFNLYSPNYSNGPQTFNLGNQVVDNSAQYYHEQNTNYKTYQRLKSEARINSLNDNLLRQKVPSQLHPKTNFGIILTKLWYFIASTISLLIKLIKCIPIN